MSSFDSPKSAQASMFPWSPEISSVHLADSMGRRCVSGLGCSCPCDVYIQSWSTDDMKGSYQTPHGCFSSLNVLLESFFFFLKILFVYFRERDREHKQAEGKRS